MGRKVLISFLGTGNPESNVRRVYKSANYKIDEILFKDKSFVSVVLSEHFKIDTHIFIGTMKSMWEELYRIISKKTDDEIISDKYYQDLSEISEKSDNTTELDSDIFLQLEKLLGNGSKIIPIKYGLNEEELKENLASIQILNSILLDNDELFIDITHSFRSLPILLTTSLMYLRDVSNKSIQVNGIYYGMLEVIRELGFAPIVNIGLLDKMNNWIKGAYTFKNFGNAELITTLLGENNEISKKLNNFSQAVEINYVSTLKQQIESFKNLNLESLDVFANLVVPQVLNDLTDKFKRCKTDSQFQIELADWYADKHIYSSAYIVLAEALVTYVYEQEKYPDVLTLDNKTHRDYRKEARQKIIKDNKYLFIKNDTSYFTIDKIRNKIAHASIENRDNAFLSDIQNLKNRIRKAKAIIYKTSNL